MARQHLEIRTPDGQAVRRRLSRRNPIVVGRSAVSDVHVEDESVAPIHCRVSWNGKSFEVAAVGGEGVDVNGVLVRRKELSQGDVIRVGETDLVMLNGSGESVPTTAAAFGESPRKKSSSPAQASDIADPLDDVVDFDDEPIGLEDDEWSALSAGEIEMPVVAPLPRSQQSQRSTPPEPPPSAEATEQPVLLDEPGTTVSEKAPATAPRTADAEPKRRWGGVIKSKRPGEEDILTSPLVLGLGGLALCLLLAAGAIWLLIGREGADRLYNAAVADREAGRYAQAIANYEQFLLEYPSDGRALDARFALGLTQIERYAGGSTPDFDRALVAFDEFVRTNRDAPGFDSQREPLRNLARQIASGASAAATRTGDRSFLAPAQEGQRLFERYAPSDGSGDAERRRLATEYATAEAAVRKREYLDDAAAKIDAAVAKSDFGTAFSTHFDLVTRFPDLRNDRRVRSLLNKALDAQKQLVRETEPPAAAVDEQPAIQPVEKVVTLISHTQARAGTVSDGRLVFAVAGDALVGLDAVTGRPVWRVPIGLDTPFFPIEVDASLPALLAFDASRNELILLRRDTGEPVWRTATGAAASGPPLITQGQIDLATSDGRLIRFDLETGKPLTTVSFSQTVIGPPVLTSGDERLVLFGEQSTAYTLNLRTLVVESVSFVGHATGAIAVPPQALGRLVIACVNDRLDSAVVRAFSVNSETGALQPLASQRIEGQVRQPPVARGNLLFVPSSPERITAFSVSDDPGQPPMTRLSGIQIPDAKDVPTYLVPGPDGMLWAAGSALRKLRLAPEGLELLPGSLATGRHTQPPQESGESLFVARSLPSAAAVYVSQADREAMTGSWRTVLGAAPVVFAADERGATIVTAAGQAAMLRQRDLEESPFINAAPLPQWNEEASEPLQGEMLESNRAVVWRNADPPLLWSVNAGGSVAAPRRLAAPLQSAPAALDGGLVLPTAEGLTWLPSAAGGASVEAFRLPITAEQNESPQWRSVIRLDSERVAALDDRGTLRVVRLRREPLPHLAEVASITFDAPLARPLAAVGDRVAIVLDDQIQLLDPAGLRPVAEASLSNITGGPWTADDAVFVELGSNELVSLDSQSLNVQWKVKLDASVTGTPLPRSNGWLIASQTGELVEVGDEGRELSRRHVGEAIDRLANIADVPVALTLGGSLLVINGDGEAPSDAQPEPAGPRQEAGE